MTIILAAHSADLGIALSPSNNDVLGDTISPDDCYAGIQFRSDGTEYSAEDDSSSYVNSRGNWLDNGEAEDVWIQWVRTGGTLGDWNDADDGDTRLQMNANRAWRITRSSLGTNTLLGRFDFYNAASGGRLLHQTDELTFRATVSA